MSYWTSLNIFFKKVVSPYHSTVFQVSFASLSTTFISRKVILVHFSILLFLKKLHLSTFQFFCSSALHRITNGMIFPLNSCRLSRCSEYSCWYFSILSFLFVCLFHFLWHSICTMYISYFILSCQVTSGLFNVWCVLIRCSQSHRHFFGHFFLSRVRFFIIYWNRLSFCWQVFPHSTDIIFSALSCLLVASFSHPVNRWYSCQAFLHKIQESPPPSSSLMLVLSSSYLISHAFLNPSPVVVDVCLNVQFTEAFRTSSSIRSCSQMFFKIGDLKNFAILTGKRLCWSLFS